MPSKKPAGYSGTPLPKKLGIKPGAIVGLEGPGTGGLRENLVPWPDGASLEQVQALPRRYDVVVAFFVDRTAMVARFDELKPLIEETGGLWIGWPKAASKMTTDISGDIVRSTGLAAGLVQQSVRDRRGLVGSQIRGTHDEPHQASAQAGEVEDKEVAMKVLNTYLLTTLLRTTLLVGALAMTTTACSTSGAASQREAVTDEAPTGAKRAAKKYTVQKHPLMLTRAGGPRTSLAVALENGFDLPLTISREASLSFKRYSNSGIATSSTSQLDEALVLATPSTKEVAKLNNGSTLHRTNLKVKISEAVPLQTLMVFLKRVEKSPYLTASEVEFKTTSNWWGVCKSKTKLVISSWFARGRVSLPETQVHMPKVSATRVAYELVAAMRDGELTQVSVGPKGFKASGIAKSHDVLGNYASAIHKAHRCIDEVDIDGQPGANGTVAFSLTGKLKCRTR